MGSAPYSGREETARPAQSQAQAYLANLELAARAADGGQISFNRAVLTFPPAIKNDIFINEARSGRLDAFGYLSYAATAMPRGMSVQERRRAAELVSHVNGRLAERMSQGAGESIEKRLDGMAGASARFAALDVPAQIAEINSVTDISRALETGSDAQRQETFRRFLNGGSRGVAGAEWSRAVLDTIYDRDGRVRGEVERRAGSNDLMVQAFSTSIMFSPAERNEITAWLEGRGRLGSETYNKLNDIITGNVRGDGRDVLAKVGLDFPMQASATAHDPLLQNIYDANSQIFRLGRALEGR